MKSYLSLYLSTNYSAYITLGSRCMDARKFRGRLFGRWLD